MLEPSGADEAIKQLDERLCTLALADCQWPKVEAQVKANLLNRTMLYFTETLKTDERVKAIFQTKILVDLKALGIQQEIKIDQVIAALEEEFPLIRKQLTRMETKTDQVLTKVDQLLDRQQAPAREIAPFIHNIPNSGSSTFVGREADLERLHQALQQPGSMTLIAVKGMGGVGKTELAIQYARQHLKPNYPGGVCWLSGRTEDLAGQLIGFAQSKFGITFPEQTKELKAQVGYCWDNWLLAGSVLVVVDDLDKLYTFRL